MHKDSVFSSTFACFWGICCSSTVDNCPMFGWINLAAPQPSMQASWRSDCTSFDAMVASNSVHNNKRFNLKLPKPQKKNAFLKM